MSKRKGLVLTILLPAICAFLTLVRPTLMADNQTGVEGVILVSPSHPGPIRQGLPNSAPIANMEFTAQSQAGAAASFKTDDQGHFRVVLAPGHYSVSANRPKTRIGRFGPFDVEVTAGKMT